MGGGGGGWGRGGEVRQPWGGGQPDRSRSLVQILVEPIFFIGSGETRFLGQNLSNIFPRFFPPKSEFGKFSISPSSVQRCVSILKIWSQQVTVKHSSIIIAAHPAAPGLILGIAEYLFRCC